LLIAGARLTVAAILFPVDNPCDAVYPTSIALYTRCALDQARLAD